MHLANECDLARANAFWTPRYRMSLNRCHLSVVILLTHTAQYSSAPRRSCCSPSTVERPRWRRCPRQKRRRHQSAETHDLHTDTHLSAIQTDNLRRELVLERAPLRSGLGTGAQMRHAHVHARRFRWCANFASPSLCRQAATVRPTTDKHATSLRTSL